MKFKQAAIADFPHVGESSPESLEGEEVEKGTKTKKEMKKKKHSGSSKPSIMSSMRSAKCLSRELAFALTDSLKVSPATKCKTNIHTPCNSRSGTHTSALRKFYSRTRTRSIHNIKRCACIRDSMPKRFRVGLWCVCRSVLRSATGH